MNLKKINQVKVGLIDLLWVSAGLFVDSSVRYHRTCSDIVVFDISEGKKITQLYYKI
jgi:hypothetical protein